jgi:FkbM family methyltransferase
VSTARSRSAIRALPWPRSARRAVHGVRLARRRWDTRRVERRLAGPKILRRFADAYPAAFFVEIGANDGDQHDHLRPILDSTQWRGIMVEPVPYVFERLAANYGGHPHIALENAAIADRDGELPFYHLREADDREAAGLPRWYDGIGSFSEEAVLGHAALLPDVADRLTRVAVPCLTFDSLLAKHDVDRTDLLIVDTEGYDQEILCSIDWERHRPLLVVYEHYHLGDDDRAQLRAAFTDRGYEIKEEGFDTWCLHADAEERLQLAFGELEPAIPAASVHRDR